MGKRDKKDKNDAKTVKRGKKNTKRSSSSSFSPSPNDKDTILTNAVRAAFGLKPKSLVSARVTKLADLGGSPHCSQNNPSCHWAASCTS